MKKVVKFTLHFAAAEKGILNGSPPQHSSSAGVGAINHTLTFTLISGTVKCAWVTIAEFQASCTLFICRCIILCVRWVLVSICEYSD